MAFVDLLLVQCKEWAGPHLVAAEGILVAVVEAATTMAERLGVVVSMVDWVVVGAEIALGRPMVKAAIGMDWMDRSGLALVLCLPQMS